MGRSASTFLISILTALASGCVQRTLHIDSDPPGALVYMNDQEIGRTPVSRDFTWYGKYDVQLRMEGYETLSTTMDLVAPPWLWPPFDLLAELAPWHIKDIRSRTYTLKAASTQPTDEGKILARAEELHGKLQSSGFTRAPATRPSTQPAR